MQAHPGKCSEHGVQGIEGGGVGNRKAPRMEGVCRWRSDGEEANCTGYGSPGKEFRLRTGDQLDS